MIELSGGEFQRALLARAMIRRPDLLVLDEPVQGVDFSGEVFPALLEAGLRIDGHVSTGYWEDVLLRVGATGGTVTPQFARVAGAGTATLRTNSYLVVQRFR